MSSDSLTDFSTLFSVEGLVAVITGGATGIGLMIATALESSGATVYIVGRRKEALDKAIRERSQRGNIIALEGDVTSRESLQAIVSAVKERHGYINLLVNNAGVMPTVQPPIPNGQEVDIKTYQDLLWNMDTPQNWLTTYGVNVTGVWYCTVAFLELLHLGNEKSKPRGITSQVITISSLASFRKDRNTFSLPYTMSKVAATHLGKVMAHYLKDWHIRSNVIAPGIFPSEMSEGVVPDDAVRLTVPLGRLGGIDDIGGLVIYLASKAGSYVDGGVHLLDGGRLLALPSTF